MPNPPDALTIEEHFFADDGRVPNNPSLPLIVYRSALETARTARGESLQVARLTSRLGGVRRRQNREMNGLRFHCGKP